MVAGRHGADIIIIGAGHAGVEAAVAAARMGADALLITQSIETIGQMSCNPAIGGLGKSHLVREIDALGGIMAEAADEAGIQFRVLNASKGAAVRATRAQTDRALYKAAVRERVENQADLRLVQQEVVNFNVESGRVVGVETALGVCYTAKAVILTTGTFLGGLIHVGTSSLAGGRAGERPATQLAVRLRDMGFDVGRLKTGTPPRLDGRSLDLKVMEVQPSDDPLPVMSFVGEAGEHPVQRPCYITHTNPTTHDIIRAALKDSPLYSGRIEGVGPRYCPSIEDKVVRFSERRSHQIFMEPEGLNTQEYYPNGISTSLPFEAQVALVRSIKGCEAAHITRPGYAIEYDYLDPRGLWPWLETRQVEGLFLAGQINGTTGYEEAAAQGLLAGINAALKVSGRGHWVPSRREAYLGVLVDDLITQGVTEPYRMFTSRAEYRVLLREDNADARLTPKGRELGLVDERRWCAYEARQARVAALTGALRSARVAPASTLAKQLEDRSGTQISRNQSAFDLLRRPEIGAGILRSVMEPEIEPHAHSTDWERVKTEASYAGYLPRMEREIEQLRMREATPIPKGFAFNAVKGLSAELVEKLEQRAPENLAQASRIDGMTPAALSILLVYLRRDEAA